ncbi:MAG: GIY-YIG nuclease family protein [Thaumarchaeota archaeon]|nr:GIY-YIG nuclease family protein [Nitrososphaerota archaeon]
MARTSISGSILQDYSERYNAEQLENIYKAMNKIGISSGIYALYRDDELYYIGKSINLKKRLQDHKKNPHTKNWNKFRIFLIKDIKILDDVETMLITVSRPKGNGNKGIFPKRGELEKMIHNEIKAIKK